MLTELLTVISILLTIESSDNTMATINKRKADLSSREPVWPSGKALDW